MADKLRIVNRALQRIGAKQLDTLTENSRERRAIDAAYDDIVEQELMTNFWTFAICRIEIDSDQTQAAEVAEVVNGGTGYVVGDILTVQGGTFAAQAQYRVSAVDGSGSIGDVDITSTRGQYTEVPS